MVKSRTLIGGVKALAIPAGTWKRMEVLWNREVGGFSDFRDGLLEDLGRLQEAHAGMSEAERKAAPQAIRDDDDEDDEDPQMRLAGAIRTFVGSLVRTEELSADLVRELASMMAGTNGIMQGYDQEWLEWDASNAYDEFLQSQLEDLGDGTADEQEAVFRTCAYFAVFAGYASRSPRRFERQLATAARDLGLSIRQATAICSDLSKSWAEYFRASPAEYFQASTAPNPSSASVPSQPKPATKWTQPGGPGQPSASDPIVRGNPLESARDAPPEWFPIRAAAPWSEDAKESMDQALVAAADQAQAIHALVRNRPDLLEDALAILWGAAEYNPDGSETEEKVQENAEKLLIWCLVAKRWSDSVA